MSADHLIITGGKPVRFARDPEQAYYDFGIAVLNQDNTLQVPGTAIYITTGAYIFTSEVPYVLECVSGNMIVALQRHGKDGGSYLALSDEPGR